MTERVAIVTGAAQGIGEAIARKLAELGGRGIGIDTRAKRLSPVTVTLGGCG